MPDDLVLAVLLKTAIHLDVEAGYFADLLAALFADIAIRLQLGKHRRTEVLAGVVLRLAQRRRELIPGQILHLRCQLLGLRQLALVQIDRITCEPIGLLHADTVLFVRTVQALIPLDVSTQAGKLHGTRIVSRQSSRHGELARLGNVIHGADGAIPGQRLIDELLLACQHLPHHRVVAALGGVGIDAHALVLIALTDDAPLALLKVCRIPWCVQMVQRAQALLRIDASAHVLAAADQNAHAPGVHVTEQLLFGLRLLVV